MHSFISHRSLQSIARTSLQLSKRQHQIHTISRGTKKLNNNVSHHRHQSTTAATNTSSSSSNNSSSSTASTFGKIFFPSLCAITFTLGTWQTKRYFEKVEMVQQRKDDLSLLPLSFDEWSKNNSSSGAENKESETTSKSYRRVTITGQFDHNNSILVGPRGPPPGALATTGPNSGMGGGGGMSSSMQGYWVITPLVVGEEKVSVGSGGENVSVELIGGKEKKGWLSRLLLWKRRNDNASVAKSDHECCSATSSEATTTSSSNDKQTIVWINRGWIPRHYINQNTNQVLQSWDEPSGHVTLLSMESQMEKGGGMFTPPSRIDSVGKKNVGEANNSIVDKKIVKKLLWMDRKAMEEMTNIGSSDEHPPLFVQINTDTTEMNEPKSFPVQPSEEYVGEFKVTPDVHMGYAVTWFGLSGAGVVMTRKLLTRGR